MLRVISPYAFNVILSRHPCFCDSTVLNDVCHDIVTHAVTARLCDIYRFILPAFRMWKKSTTFWPPVDVIPNLNHIVSPVKECTRSHDKIFIRNRFDVGVLFATFVPIDNREVGIVWATNRRAYVFDYHFLKGWVLFKVLNRQDDPFQTWMRHLGGDRIMRMQERDDRVRSGARLFHDLVVPYYGTHPKARDKTRMRGIRNDDPVWELVKRVSYMVVPEDAVERFEWKRG